MEMLGSFVGGIDRYLRAGLVGTPDTSVVTG
jgi:hypothetical protein